MIAEVKKQLIEVHEGNTGCPDKNYTGFLLNSSGHKAAKYKANILIPTFSSSKSKMLILKTIWMK